MSVIGFQKKIWMGLGGWGELHPSLFWIFGFFLTLVLVACGHSLPANDLRKPDLSNVPNLHIQL